MAGSRDGYSGFLFRATPCSLRSVVSIFVRRVWAPTSGRVCVRYFAARYCRFYSARVPVGRCGVLLGGLGWPCNGTLGTRFLGLLLASCDRDGLRGGDRPVSGSFYPYRVRSGRFVFQAALDASLGFPAAAPRLAVRR